MTATTTSRRAAPIAAVLLTFAAASVASWAAFAPDGPTASPVLAPQAPTTTAAVTSTVASPTMAATPATVATPDLSVTVPPTTVPPTTVPPTTGASTSTTAPVDDRVVLASVGPLVEAWSPAGRLGAAEPCRDRPDCRVLASAWADGSVVSGVVGTDGVTTRSSIVRAPLDGGAATTVAELPPDSWVRTVVVVGGEVWWSELPPAGTPHGIVRRAALARSGPPVEVARDVLGFAPDPSGRRIALQRPGDPVHGGSTLAVVDLDTGAERTMALGADLPWSSGIRWIADDRLLLQGAEVAAVVAADGDLRITRTAPFIASCVDGGGRVVGVQRTRNDDGSMRHTVADVDPATGRVTPWAGAALDDGSIACRGDGAVVALTFATAEADTELAVVRASGRRTVLGRGYNSVVGALGGGGFSSMNCGPGGVGANGPV